MPFLAYIHAREPDPGPGDERRPWEPNWRLWRWVLAAAVFAFLRAVLFLPARVLGYRDR